MKNKTIVAGVVVAVAALAGYIFFRGEEKPAGDFVIVKRVNLVQEVSVTGKVKPAKSVDLAVEKGGRVVSVSAGVGARVGAGQTLVKLDDSELAAQLAKAEADLASSKADSEKAAVDLANYYEDIENILNDAYAKANDAVRKQLDDLFSDDEKTPLLTFSTSDIQLKTNLELQRLRLTPELDDWLSELRVAGESTIAEKLGFLATAKNRLMKVRALLDDATKTVINSTNLSASNTSDYQANINTAKTNVNTALASISSQEQNISSQKAVVASKEAGIKSAEANVASIMAQMEKLVLRSPIGGIITKQDAKVGEIVKANEVVATVISAGSFEIEANVPEADIAKLKIGNRASVTLDAYGRDAVFGARVRAIDPAETVIEGVSTYKTTFNFEKEDARIKSGMTANIDVVTAEKEGVVVVPQRAVITRDGGKFILVDTGGETPEERAVETGLRGSDGNIEITSGLEEGEKVAPFGEL